MIEVPRPARAGEARLPSWLSAARLGVVVRWAGAGLSCSLTFLGIQRLEALAAACAHHPQGGCVG